MEKKNVIITALAISLGVASTIAVVVPVVLTTTSVSNQASQVSSIRTTNVFGTFAETLKNKTLEEMNISINENKAHWSTWVESLNEKGAVIDGAILDVSSVKILITPTTVDANSMTMGFGIDWNENYNISSSIASKVIVLNPISVTASWGENNPKPIVQRIINETSSYENIGAITTSLNLPANKSKIKALINQPETIEDINITMAGTGPSNYTLKAETTYKEGYNINGSLTDIVGLSAVINSSIEWNDLGGAKIRIQELISSKNSYNNTIEIASYLNNADNNQIIKGLTNNQAAIKKLTVSVSGTGPNNYVVSAGIEYNNGFSGPAKLADITGLETTLIVDIGWSNAETSKKTIQDLINAGQYTTISHAAIKAELDKSQTIIKNLISNNSAINNIEITVDGTGPDSYGVNIAITYKLGYTGLTSIGIQNLSASQTIAVDWTDPVNAKTKIQELITNGGNSGTYDNLAAIQTMINNKLGEIKNLLSNSDKISSLDAEITGSANEYSISIKNIVYNAGFINSESPSIITGLTANISSKIGWSNDATESIQTLVNQQEPYANMKAIEDKLNQHQEQIKTYTNNSAAIQTINIVVTGTTNNYTVEVSIIDYTPGFTGPEKLPAITGITANIQANISWKTAVSPKIAIDEIIGQAGYADITAIQAKLNQNKPDIRALIEGDDNIQDINMVVSGEINNYTVTVNATEKPGLIIVTPLTPITGMKANIIANITWKETANSELQTLINTNAPYSSKEAIGTFLNTKIDEIKNLTNNPGQIGDIALTVEYPSTPPFSYSVKVQITSYAPGYNGTVILDDLIGQIPPNWNNQANATTAIQALINEGDIFYDNVGQVQEKLMLKQEEIKSLIDNSSLIQNITAITLTKVGNTTEYEASFNLEYVSGETSPTLSKITGLSINLNQVVEPAWKTNATETIQTLINQNSYNEATAATEIQSHLSTALDVAKIKELTTNSEQINTTSVQVTKVDTKFSVLVSITDYNTGFKGPSKLAIIENLTANFNVSYSVNQTEATTLTQEIAANTSITNLGSLNSWLANSAQADTLKTLIDATPPAGLASVSASAELIGENWVITLNPTPTTGYTNITTSPLTISMIQKVEVTPLWTNESSMPGEIKKLLSNNNFVTLEEAESFLTNNKNQDIIKLTDSESKINSIIVKIKPKSQVSRPNQVYIVTVEITYNPGFYGAAKLPTIEIQKA